MNRKVSICTLYASKAQGAADYLEQKLGQYTETLKTEDFGDISVFAARAADLAEDGRIVVAAAPVDEFLNAKFRFLKALSLKIVKSKAILGAMGENAPSDPKLSDLQAAVPHKANVVLSADGLYSAFAADDDGSTVVFLPLDEDRLAYLFSNGLEAVFTGGAVAAKAAPAPKTKMQELKDRVNGVISSGKTVAVAAGGCSKMLLQALSAVEGSENTFIEDYSIREREENEAAADYIAQCAKASKENSGADLGISISGIYNDNEADGDFVIVCVADSDRAKAAKVYAKPGEDKKLLIVAAIIKLCGMLDELSGAAGLVNPNPPAAAPKKWKKNSKLPLIIAIIGIAAAIIACVVTAFVLSDKDNDTAMTFAEQNAYLQQEENTLSSDDDYEYDYQGGSFLEFEDTGFFVEDTSAAETSTLGFIMSNPVTTRKATTAKTTVRQTVTNLITAIASTTKKITTTKPTTTTTKPTTTTTTKAATTKATTTTTKPATTKATTTNVTTTVEAGTASDGSKGTFVFRVYGYGHGVGMSQEGAIQMAKNGKTYDEILTNYFIGTSIKTDSSTPSTVKYGGTEIPIVEYLCRTTKREIGPSAPMEALKAQVVSAYTFAKYYDFDVKKSLHAYDSSYDYVGTNIHKACLEVLGMSGDSDTPSAKYVDYNGSAAFTCYFASSPGKTASSDSVWGGGNDKYPYLIGGASSPEEVDKTTVEISAEDMRAYIEEYAEDNNKEIVLSDNPAEWLEIVSHDGAYDANTGYITEIRIGNYSMRGNAFRSYVVDFKLRSHCFSFEYIPA